MPNIRLAHGRVVLEASELFAVERCMSSAYVQDFSAHGRAQPFVENARRIYRIAA